MAKTAKVFTLHQDQGIEADILVTNPRSGQALYTLGCASAEEIKTTYQQARRAFKTLRQLSIAERVEEIRRLQQACVTYQDEIIERICAETGRPEGDALSELLQVMAYMNFLRQHSADILKDQIVPTPPTMPGKHSRLFYQPMGTVLVIAPWNFPFALTLNPALSAFVAGNAVIIKPSEITPLCGVLEMLLKESDFLTHAIQVIYGGKETGVECVAGKPDKLFFTGSTHAGRQVYQQAAEHLIPVDLELSGKDPMIVFDDVNISRAAAGCVWGCLYNSGQMCTSVERVYVQKTIHDEFVDAVKSRLENVQTISRAAREDENIALDYGTMTAPFQLDIIQDHIDDALAKGATLLFGGRQVGTTQEFEPTLLTGITDDMKIATEETFGPVVAISSFNSEDEVIQRANRSNFGLGSSVWSRDMKRATRVAHQMEAGACNINNVNQNFLNIELPFGGVKDSGIGRHMGSEGLHTFSNQQSVVIDKDGPSPELLWSTMTKARYELLQKFPALLADDSIWSKVKMIWYGLKMMSLSRKSDKSQQSKKSKNIWQQK